MSFIAPTRAALISSAGITLSVAVVGFISRATRRRDASTARIKSQIPNPPPLLPRIRIRIQFRFSPRRRASRKMTSPNRLPQGGALIDRARPLSFSFDGETLPGFVGDTLASALLARGVRPLARSFKYRRPRGIYSAGIEEPSAIVTVGEGARLEPGARAPMVELFDGLVAKSQSGWPSPRFDVGAATGWFSRLMPPGFYYKTFMWPPKLWRFYERCIRRAASAAPAPDGPDPDSYLHRHAHCEVLIVGGGPAATRRRPRRGRDRRARDIGRAAFGCGRFAFRSRRRHRRRAARGVAGANARQTAAAGQCDRFAAGDGVRLLRPQLPDRRRKNQRRRAAHALVADSRGARRCRRRRVRASACFFRQRQSARDARFSDGRVSAPTRGFGGALDRRFHEQRQRLSPGHRRRRGRRARSRLSICARPPENRRNGARSMPASLCTRPARLFSRASQAIPSSPTLRA